MSSKKRFLASSMALFYLATLGAEQEATQPKDSCSATNKPEVPTLTVFAAPASPPAPPKSDYQRKKNRKQNPGAFLNRGNKRAKYG